MPRQFVTLSMALDMDEANAIEKVAYENHLRFSGAGRALLDERIELERLGWKFNDEELTTLLGAVAAVKPERRRYIVKALGEILILEAGEAGRNRGKR